MKKIEEIRINSSYTSRLMADYGMGISKREDSEPIRRTSVMRTEQYIEKFVNQFDRNASEISLTPPNCRFLKTYPNDLTIAVIEEPPAMRSIRVRMDMTRDAEALKNKKQWKEFGYENFFSENSRPYIFMLAIPYVIHLLQFNGKKFSRGKLFFRPKPLLGMSDILYRPPLLNISGDMSVCYGDTVYKGSHTSITSEAEHVASIFWSATFNPDYIDNYYKYSNIAGLCDFFTWQYYSQTNPMFIYTADWIPVKKTIGEYIKTFEKNNVPENSVFGYKNLIDLFTKPVISSKTVDVGRQRLSRNLIYDICNGWFPEPRLSVYIGDPIKYTKDRIGYIDCFIGISGCTGPMYVRIKVDDKLLTFKVTEKTKEFFAAKIKELRYEEFVELPDKTKLKSGDIIIMKNMFDNPVYKKLYYIRKAVDDRLELRIGSEYWFADVIDWSTISKLDMEKPEVDGILIDKHTQYEYFLSGYYPTAPFSNNFTTVKYDELTTGDNNNLIAIFYGVESGSSYNFSLDENVPRPKKLYKKSEMEDVPKIFFVGRTLLSYIDVNNYAVKIKRHKDFGLIASNQLRRNSAILFSNLCKEFISEDGISFHAESNNLIVDFSIGDKVIISNWEQPLTMLSIKTIKGFIKESEKGTISFLIEDKNGTASTIEYVNSAENVIYTGKIRKATNELNGITIGTKIIAKESGISCFPKKDVNIIVAFIVDTGGEPLVLCSNGCTLWFTDVIEKFELIKMKSPRWKKLNHTPLDPSKIKLQSGDIVNVNSVYSNRNGFLVVKNNNAGGLRFARLDYYYEYDEYVETKKSFIRNLILDCIPNPRMTLPKQRDKGFNSGFPNFHGGVSITQTHHSHYKFIDESGRF